MDFAERIAELSKKVKTIGEALTTEEATKNALIMPFIAALGYDVFFLSICSLPVQNTVHSYYKVGVFSFYYFRSIFLHLFS